MARGHVAYEPRWFDPAAPAAAHAGLTDFSGCRSLAVRNRRLNLIPCLWPTVLRHFVQPDAEDFATAGSLRGS
jgi:hypothetical protein